MHNFPLITKRPSIFNIPSPTQTLTSNFIPNLAWVVNFGERKFSSKNRLINIKLSNYLSSIKDILSTHRNDPYNAQMSIEKKWIDVVHEDLDVNKSLYAKQSMILDNAYQLLELFQKNGNLNRLAKSIKNHIVDKKHIYLTFSHILSGYNKTSLTNISYRIGYSITKRIYFKNYINDYHSYEYFLASNNFDDPFFIKLGDIFIQTFISPINPIFERLFLNDIYVLRVNEQFKEEILHNLIISPQSLPMVSKPLTWGHGILGGNLLNNNDEYRNKLVTGSAQHSHTTKTTSDIYNAVNKLNNLKFKVNTDLLDYLENDGSFILDYYNDNKMDKYINNIISMKIAEVYKNIPIYLNVNIDWRGRIYTQSFYLDYQGSEFSLALLNLFEGKKLDENGLFFFYVYGANVYNENGDLDKKSLQERYNWVVNNLLNIYSMDKDFILKAESPTIFASFCLTMIKLRDNSNYIVYNPIFLDATCSGVQHFAAMLLDLELSKYVNLVNTNDSVNDFYSQLIPSINQAIKDSYKDNVKNIKFQDINLNRALLKRVIMTKSYNVTTYGITEQLKSKLEKVQKVIIVKDKEKTVYDYLVPTKKGNIQLDMYEIERLADIINNNIFNQFPKLHSIYNYITRLSKIYMRLNIPISWSTPNGLELTQRYNQSKIQKLTINFLGKNRTAVIRKWTTDKDSRREVQAIIPNIIHSLDASHLTLIINRWDKYILPIHDCFGTHPNDMINLSEIVRNCFVSLYSSKDFLHKIDKKFRDNLIDYKIPIILKDGEESVKIRVGHRNEILPLPILPTMGDLNINDINDKGKNMIN